MSQWPPSRQSEVRGRSDRKHRGTDAGCNVGEPWAFTLSERSQKHLEHRVRDPLDRKFWIRGIQGRK